jgi:hypothetical protein
VPAVLVELETPAGAAHGEPGDVTAETQPVESR